MPINSPIDMKMLINVFIFSFVFDRAKEQTTELNYNIKQIKIF